MPIGPASLLHEKERKSQSYREKYVHLREEMVNVKGFVGVETLLHASHIALLHFNITCQSHNGLSDVSRPISPVMRAAGNVLTK